MVGGTAGLVAVHRSGRGGHGVGITATMALGITGITAVGIIHGIFAPASTSYLVSTASAKQPFTHGPVAFIDAFPFQPKNYFRFVSP